jgi:dTDP-4-dehydrorhamnose 3,5-epimerase
MFCLLRNDFLRLYPGESGITLHFNLMNLSTTTIPEILIIEPQIFADQRGYFLETFQDERYAALGISQPFVQDNYSGSRRGVLRGLHYQIYQPQGKLVSVTVGEIFDVAVDLRESSETFGDWVGMILSADNRKQVWVPAGFAHGYLALSGWAEIEYKVTDYYVPEAERTLLWNDTQLGINWPLDAGKAPILSEKDAAGTPLDQAETFPE